MAVTPRSTGHTEAPHYSPTSPSEDARTVLINRVAWGAIAAGVVISLVAQALLNLAGVGVGLGTLDPGTSDNPSAQTFTIAAGVWWAVSGILAALAGGYAAGRLSGDPKESTAAWHGLTTWAATTLVIIYLASTAAASLVGGALNAVSSAAEGLGNVAGSLAQSAGPALSDSNPFSSIEQQIRSTGNDPNALKDAAVTSMRAVVTGDQSQAERAKQQAAEALARSQNIPVEQARERVTEYEKQYRETVNRAKEQATAAADATAKAASRGALLATLALVLGAAAGWFGGRMGAVYPTLTSQRLVESERMR
jgi:hypothetical protein